MIPQRLTRREREALNKAWVDEKAWLVTRTLFRSFEKHLTALDIRCEDLLCISMSLIDDAKADASRFVADRCPSLWDEVIAELQSWRTQADESEVRLATTLILYQAALYFQSCTSTRLETVATELLRQIIGAYDCLRFITEVEKPIHSQLYPLMAREGPTLLAEYVTSRRCLSAQIADVLSQLPPERLSRVNADGLPDILRSARALSLWDKLYDAGLVDQYCQPLGSRTEMAIIAKEMAGRLSICNHWKVFGTLWNKMGLGSAYSKAHDTQKGWDFEKRVRSILS